MTVRVKDHPDICERKDIWAQFVLPSEPEVVDMGPVHASLELMNSDDLALLSRGLITDDQVKRVEVNALVDTGASTLCINEVICAQLGLRTIDRRAVQMADGSVRPLDLAGPVEIRLENRRSTLSALVLPSDSEVVLGAIPLEDMDVFIDSVKRQLVVNPAGRNMAMAKAKSPRRVRQRAPRR